MSNNNNEKGNVDLNHYLCLGVRGRKPRYYVSDIENCNKKEVEYILLCESPHKDEVNHKDTNGDRHPLPLVGKSGKTVSDYLFKAEDPIGELLFKDKDEKNHKYPRMAIVNVSNVPLQIISGINQNAIDLDLESIRDGDPINESLRDNLKTRLKSYSEAKTIILCGSCADAYYSAIKSEFKFTTTILVPHPARCQWQKVDKYMHGITDLKSLFSKYKVPEQ